ncbi:hypothetical protein MPTK1_5g22490 [Marchantia polymorpha subsp. ruderalis]|uniref:Uncharacterized protein n=2 Tax=Marchantia polymorpha TaxID=3197 RepID=A0AAF6BL49_MARPO|nr:hypothetical protein MARPO_0010s0208 [Marchantia polymorpha]BBN12733.1 hypothetical protein Mp_5g22490 [Marchantia polymorpha subsp. ruderalis]|eukprot:PTQ46848.1 hypothetical protein MARPO_0010s0208 [Marchantia polymorpha]
MPVTVSLWPPKLGSQSSTFHKLQISRRRKAGRPSTSAGDNDMFFSEIICPPFLQFGSVWPYWEESPKARKDRIRNL